MVRNSLSLSWQLAVCSFFRNWLGRRRMWKSALWEGKTAWVLSSRHIDIFLSLALSVFLLLVVFSHSFRFHPLPLLSFPAQWSFCIKWNCTGSLSQSAPQPSGDNSLGCLASHFPPLSHSETIRIFLGITKMSVKHRVLCIVCVRECQPVKYIIYLLQVLLWYCRMCAKSWHGPAPWCTITSSCFPPDRTNVTTTSKCWCHVMTRLFSPVARTHSTLPAATIRWDTEHCQKWFGVSVKCPWLHHHQLPFLNK